MLAPIGEAKADVIVKAAEAALSDRGPSFSIRASWGKVELPSEAQTPADALRIADRRMYTQKGQRTDSALSQTRGVLLGLLREREPGLDRHLGDVARLAAEMGRALELETEDIDVLVRAAEMHDIGKVAIPDEILHKNGPLTDAERDLMHKHTLVGERVLAAAPALLQVSKVVRSSHEHWDGSGYPDGLAGNGDPARVTHHPDLRRVQRDDRVPALRSADGARRSDRGDTALGGPAVRPRSGGALRGEGRNRRCRGSRRAGRRGSPRSRPGPFRQLGDHL